MLRPMRRALPFCLVLALASLTSSSAFAEGASAADKATAKTLATEGDAALKKKDYQTAFAKFDEAARLVPDSRSASRARSSGSVSRSTRRSPTTTSSAPPGSPERRRRTKRPNRRPKKT